MDATTWAKLSSAEREKLRDYSGLTPELRGLEGYRVEVLDKYGDKRRFIVGQSTGWRPCHLELARRNVHGGRAVTGAPFQSVRVLYKAD